MDHSNPYAQKPLVKPPPTKTDPSQKAAGYMGDKSQMPLKELHRKLETDPAVRSQLSRDLRKSYYDPAVNDAIKEMEKKVDALDRDRNNFLSQQEIASGRDYAHPGRADFFDKKHRIAEMQKGGITKAEQGDEKREETIIHALLKFLGIR